MEKRYKYFCTGIIVASLTWTVSLYLYWTLNSETGVYKSQARFYPVHQRGVLVHKEANIPYEDDEKGRTRAKKKYLDPHYNSIGNDDIIRQKLRPFPVKSISPGNREASDIYDVGLVKNNADLKFRDDGYRLHGFNALASKNLDYHRLVPDTRHKLCDAIQYPEELPTASVIICFYNEQFDTLMRSVHSILDRTPANLLHEIILVNDFSDIDGLNDTVNLYQEANLKGNKVRIVSTKRREGLIRARIFGANKASGDVLVFLDSHIEVNKVWLEPLLSRIKENSTRVVTPIIDIINADTFQYTSSPIVRGGFNWGLHFKWENVRVGTLSTEEDFVKPIKSPTMAGGLFAMDRQYFNHLGQYDAGMNIWGGENLELSFRVWQCGGSIEIIPCSRIGHVFRKRRPYGAPDGEDTMIRNSLRVAHVWMDDYKKYYFKQRPEAENVHYGDISSRVELRRSLGCKPFSWYLENIYPELTLPSDSKKAVESKLNSLYQSRYNRKQNFIGHYQIRLSNTNLCIASEKDVRSKGSRLLLKTCLRVKNQMWSETDKGDLRLAQYLCLDADSQIPRLSKCHEMGGTQEWKHKSSNKMAIYNLASGTCLSVSEISLNSYVTLDICSSNEKSQWDFVNVYI